MKAIGISAAVGVMLGLGLIAIFDFQSPASDVLVILLAIALVSGSAAAVSKLRAQR